MDRPRNRSEEENMERLKGVTEERNRGEGTRTAFGLSGMITLVLVLSVVIFLVLWLAL